MGFILNTPTLIFDSYVTDLLRFKSTIIDRILPHSDSPPRLPSHFDYARSESITSLNSIVGTSRNAASVLESPSSGAHTPGIGPANEPEDLDSLPIAARFASPMMGHSANASTVSIDALGPRQRGGSVDTSNTTHTFASQPHRDDVTAPSTRSSTDLEQAEANDETIRIRSKQKYTPIWNKSKGSSVQVAGGPASETSKKPDRHPKQAVKDLEHDRSHKTFGKLKKRLPSVSSTTSTSEGLHGMTLTQPPAPEQLPHDLQVILETLGGPVLQGHVQMADMLRQRYEEQFPIVRSLADVFVANVCRAPCLWFLSYIH